MVRAAQEVAQGRFVALGGLLVAAAAGAVVFFLSERAGWHGRAPWAWPSLMTLGGALLFALGVRLNGACSIGTLGRLSSGDLGALATVLGMVAAFVVLPRAMLPYDPPAWAGHAQVPWVAGMVVVGVLCVVIAGGRGVLRHLGVPALLGAIAALLYSLHAQITWFDIGASAVSGPGSALTGAVGFACLLVGAFFGTHVAGRVQWRWPEPRRFARELGGGALMGAGALLIPGATDALAFYGVPSGSPHALVAWTVLFGTVVLSFWLMPAAAETPAPVEKAVKIAV